jgi:hypothetical protein
MPWAINGQISTDMLDGGIEITDAQYAEALEGIAAGKAVSIANGFEIIDPLVAPPEAPEEPDRTLDEWKVLLMMNIDSDAEAARLRYITAGSGQAMTYQQKAQEASEVLSLVGSGEVDETQFPLLSAEVGITAPTLIEVAQVVDYAYQTWRVVGAQIEALRLGGKSAVSAATTIPAAKGKPPVKATGQAA